MAWLSSYATVQQYKRRITKSKGDDDAMLELDLEASSRVIEEITGYHFNLDATVTTRIYGPRDLIDPIASLTGLVVKVSAARPVVWASETALTIDEDFEVLPRNAITEGKPHTEINLFGWSSPQSPITEPRYDAPGAYLMQVTALHGWPGGVPAAVQLSCIDYTAMVRGESAYATARFPELDGPVDVSGQARAWLRDRLMKFSRYGGVAVG